MKATVKKIYETEIGVFESYFNAARSRSRSVVQVRGPRETVFGPSDLRMAAAELIEIANDLEGLVEA